MRCAEVADAVALCVRVCVQKRAHQRGEGRWRKGGEREADRDIISVVSKSAEEGGKK